MGPKWGLTLPARRPPARKSRTSAARARRKTGMKAYLLVSPAVVLFIAFIAVPVIGIVVFSFLQWDLLTPPKFAGLSNFRMLFHDGELSQALVNSLLFDIMTTTLHIVLGMGLAIAVTSVRSRVVRYWARTAFVVPFLMSAGAVAVMWSYILSGSTGPFNYYLTRLGTSPPDWLASGTWALPSLVGVDVWQTVGITFIIFLVGLQTIPSVLYEAAAIDGSARSSAFTTSLCRCCHQRRWWRRLRLLSGRSRSLPGPMSSRAAGRATQPSRSWSTSSGSPSGTSSSAMARPSRL